MKKLKLLFFSGLMFLFGMSYAAEVTVPSGDTLQTYIEAAADGDVLILEDGGVYDKDETLVIEKSLTIKAVDGYTIRPVIVQESTNGIKYGGTPTGAEVVFKGIEFMSTGARYLNRLATGDSLAYLEMTDVVAHGYDRSIIRASDAGIFVDSVLIAGSYFYDLTGSDYRLFYFDKADCPVNYFKAVNSSFVDFSRTFLQLNSPDTKKTVIVENCNIHGRTDKREDDLFDIDGAAGTTFTLSNSIISSIKLGSIWDVRDNVTDSVTNCYYFEVDSVDHVLDNTWSYESAFTETDPMFSNGPGGALYLDAASPALTASTTGGVIGDPRWATPPPVASLLRLKVDEGMLTPTFATGTADYTVEVPYGTTSVEVSAVPNYANASVVGDSVIDVSSGSGATAVVVTAEDGVTTQTYNVAITVALPSTDASLSSLSTSLDAIVPVFDPAVLDYTADGPLGTDTVFVFAEATDGNATVVITDTVLIAAGSGVATVVVTAEDGVTTQTYTINITVDNTGIRQEAISKINMHYNSLSDRLRIFNTGDVEMVEIYSLTGALVISERAYKQESLEISTGVLPNGLYVVRMKLNANEIQTGKFVK